jgi:hypothetical protein
MATRKVGHWMTMFIHHRQLDMETYQKALYMIEKRDWLSHQHHHHHPPTNHFGSNNKGIV